MSEIATRDADHPALWAWADNARRVYAIAESLAKTSFVPKAFQGRPEEVTAAILTGFEVGLSPMAALRAIDVIQGKPAMSALAMRGLVQGAGHDIRVIESTNTRAIVEGRRRGTVDSQRSTWTTDRAKQLGLLGKDNWRTQPQAMLVARATAECCRLVAADVLLGLPYASEELVDGPDDVTPAAPAENSPTARTRRRRPLLDEMVTPPMPAPEPAPDEETADEEPPDDEPPPPEMITGGQSAMLHVLLRAHGLDRAAALAHIGVIVGHPITSTNDLTKGEASAVIDVLQINRHDAEPT